MAEEVKSKRRLRFPLYVTKKLGVASWKTWVIRGGGILLAFLLAGLVCTILKPGSFGFFYQRLFETCFDFFVFSTIIDLLIVFSLTLLIALALIPAFKMRFWNIGAEGQVLVGCLVSAAIAKFAPIDMPNVLVLFMCAGCSIVAGIIWSVIPAIFKALFNTNETLFTLMMNYIATFLCGMFLFMWDKSGQSKYGDMNNGMFSELLGNTGTIVIIFAALIFILMFFYIKKSIHGYELTVVGESVNTARYVGINVRKVIIRTAIFTGAIMGLIGFLIICAVEQDFNDSIVQGRGFSAILIAWLGHFEPGEVALFSFLAAIMEQGTSNVMDSASFSSARFSAICTGIFFFVIIACEFFSNYQIKRHHDKAFDEYFKSYKDSKKESISAIPNRFKRFFKWTWFYMSYPFVWLSKDLAFKNDAKDKKEEPTT